MSISRMYDMDRIKQTVRTYGSVSQIRGRYSGHSASIETVIEMTTTIGVTDLNTITPEQIKASLSCFIGKSVTERVINDIGNNIVAEKANPEQLQNTLRELGGYIEGCASDAVSNLTSDGLAIMDTALVGKIDEIYTNVFEILESVGGRTT